MSELGANTYMWLVWHSANDWEDLKVFLPKAAKAGISVWVYLVPPSETGLEQANLPYSEPFRLDYVRWAEEIGRLSLKHTNLVGYVIDDFWANVGPKRFSPDKIRRMVAAGKAVNPRLKFYPLMYFNEINDRFVDVLAPLVDGVVAAYPADRAAVEQALTFLEDRYHLPLIVMPASEASEYKLRYHEEGTPQRISDRVRMATKLAHEGRIEGVVTYCLDKREGTRVSRPCGRFLSRPESPADRPRNSSHEHAVCRHIRHGWRVGRHVSGTLPELAGDRPARRPAPD